MKQIHFSFFGTRIFSFQKRMIQFEAKVWFYPLLYSVIYFYHCMISWDQMQKINSLLEVQMISKNETVSVWQLYPFQIVSVYVLFLLYLVFSFIFVSILSYLRVLKHRVNYVLFLMKNIRVFFMAVCLLYIGNLILGLWSEFEFYSFLVYVFWMGIFLYFVRNNGILYSESLASKYRASRLQMKRIGYAVPILWILSIAYLVVV